MGRTHQIALCFAALFPTYGSSLSVSSCADLGWTNAATYGDATVCSESDQGLGQCSGNLNYEEAKLFCTKKYRDRGRLCTISELTNGEAQDAPCGYETSDVWTSEPCGPSDVYVYDGTSTTCQNLWVNAKVRCCADRTFGLGDCSGIRKWKSANAYCTTKGARLCTLDELKNYEGQDTGCNIDRKLIWSGTACESRTKQSGTGNYNGYYQSWGAAEFGSRTPCVNPKVGTAFVRCCADVF